VSPRRKLPSEPEVAAEVNRILAGSIKIPQNKKLKYLQEQIGRLPESWREPVENCISLGKQLASSNVSSPPTIQLLAIGAVFLLVGGFGVVYFEHREAREGIDFAAAVGA
jgi:hypothetical protein